MLTSIALGNFKSFGAVQVAPLQPITVLVGPNNSGKSNFLSVARFVRNVFLAGKEGYGNTFDQAVAQEGGLDFVLRRPLVGDGEVIVGWSTEAGSYRAHFKQAPDAPTKLLASREELLDVSGRSVWDAELGGQSDPFGRLVAAARGGAKQFLQVGTPLLASRVVQVSPRSLRLDAQVTPEPRLGPDGVGLAAVLSLWRGAQPEKAAALDDFVHQCVPEIRNVLVKPAPAPGHQRLWVRQTDQQEFDAEHVSDGLLCFIALAMLVIETPPGAVLFVEEPEQSLHPPAIRQLVDYLRGAVHERQCQFVLATHSRVVIDQFRDEPEAILRFARTDSGTRIDCVADIPDLVAALAESTPGELVETNLFNAAPPAPRA